MKFIYPFLIIVLVGFLTGVTSCTDKEKEVVISVENFGDITIKLYNETPQHRDNFLKLVDEGFYDETLFHRVIKEFMIQGGDPDSKGAAPNARLGGGSNGGTIPAEFMPQFFHKKGALAAARKGDQVNPTKASSDCQFYIVQGKKYTDQELTQLEQRTGNAITAERREAYKTVGGVPFLDDTYTVFGEVVSGLDIVDKIAATQTAPGDRPIEDVKMTMKRK